MTDEEKAEEYVDTHCCYRRQDFIRTYLEGLAEGRKEGYEQGYEDCRHYAHDYYKPKWHDLREDPNDLPKYNEEDDEDNFYLVAFRNWFDKEEIVIREFIWNGEEFLEEDYSEIPYFRKDDSLIAWCELPKFEE